MHRHAPSPHTQSSHCLTRCPPSPCHASHFSTPAWTAPAHPSWSSRSALAPHPWSRQGDEQACTSGCLQGNFAAAGSAWIKLCMGFPPAQQVCCCPSCGLAKSHTLFSYTPPLKYITQCGPPYALRLAAGLGTVEDGFQAIEWNYATSMCSVCQALLSWPHIHLMNGTSPPAPSTM